MPATTIRMRVTCSHCEMPHALSDAQLGGHTRVRFLCARCGGTTIVETNPADHTQVILPLPSFARVPAPARGAARPRCWAPSHRDLNLA